MTDIGADGALATRDAGLGSTPEDLGSAIWSQLFPNARGDGIAIAPDGDIVLTGYLVDSVDFGAGPTEGTFAGFVARFASDGTYRWVHTFDAFPNAA